MHPVFGDFTPRQRTVDFIDSAMNGGVTTAISAGEVHLPGRPKDIVGLKALAIVAAKAYANFRPGGVKVEAGAPILELGLTEADFAEMAAAGVKLVGEIGLGSVRTGRDAAPMVRWAKQHGMTVTIHTGGPSIAGSSPISAEVVLEARPHVVGHINGGTTSMAPGRDRSPGRHRHGAGDRAVRQRPHRAAHAAGGGRRPARPSGSSSATTRRRAPA